MGPKELALFERKLDRLQLIDSTAESTHQRFFTPASSFSAILDLKFPIDNAQYFAKSLNSTFSRMALADFFENGTVAGR